MAYVTKEQLVAAISDARLTQALDDDRDNAPDAELWDLISQDVDNWIDGYLERAGVEAPDPAPKSLKNAALLKAQCCLFERRNLHDRAAYIHEHYLRPVTAWLERVARGEETLVPTSSDAAAAIVQGACVTEPVRMTRTDGGLMV